MILSLYTMHKEAQVFENMIWIGKYWPSFGFSWNEASPALLCLAVKGDNTQAYRQAEHTTLHVQKHPRHSTIEYRTQNTALQSTDFPKHKTKKDMRQNMCNAVLVHTKLRTQVDYMQKFNCDM